MQLQWCLTMLGGGDTQALLDGKKMYALTPYRNIKGFGQMRQYQKILK